MSTESPLIPLLIQSFSYLPEVTTVLIFVFHHRLILNGVELDIYRIIQYLLIFCKAFFS